MPLAIAVLSQKKSFYLKAENAQILAECASRFTYHFDVPDFQNSFYIIFYRRFSDF